MNEWTQEENMKSEWNSKGLYVIIRAITPNQYKIIQNCTTSK